MITLCVIAKNEAKTLPRLIASLKGKIDKAVILDTGSTDLTKVKARRALADLGIVGSNVLIEDDPWINYGHNRTNLVQRAAAFTQGQGWLLCLDADDTLLGEVPELDPDLDGYLIRHEEPPVYYLPWILRADLPWKYVGAAHEYVMRADGKQPNYGRCEELIIRHHADGGNRDDKFQREEKLLQDDLIVDPSNPRTWYYLARTRTALQDWEGARTAYQQRISFGGWAEETYCAQVELSRVLAWNLNDYEAAIKVLISAWEARPWRAEAPTVLASIYRMQGHHRMAYAVCSTIYNTKVPKGDLLFIETWVYDWGINLELALAAWNTGRKDEGLGLMKTLKDVEVIKDLVSSNLQFMTGQSAKV